MIRKIKKEELRTMNDKEALILRGCGGDLQEWADGISGLLRDAGILKGEFQDCATFQDEDITCLLFPFEGADLAEQIAEEATDGFQSLPVLVRRNAYGRQLGSFSAEGTESF